MRLPPSFAGLLPVLRSAGGSWSLGSCSSTGAGSWLVSEVSPAELWAWSQSRVAPHQLEDHPPDQCSSPHCCHPSHSSCPHPGWAARLAGGGMGGTLWAASETAASGPWLSYPACFFASAGCSRLQTSVPGSCARAGTLPCLALCRAACSEEEPPSFYSPQASASGGCPSPAGGAGGSSWLSSSLVSAGAALEEALVGRVAPPECRRRRGGVEPLAPGRPHPPAFLLHSSLGLPGPPGPGRTCLLLHFRHCARRGWALLLA